MKDTRSYNRLLPAPQLFSVRRKNARRTDQNSSVFGHPRTQPALSLPPKRQDQFTNLISATRSSFCIRKIGAFFRRTECSSLRLKPCDYPAGVIYAHYSTGGDRMFVPAIHRRRYLPRYTDKHTVDDALFYALSKRDITGQYEHGYFAKDAML